VPEPLVEAMNPTNVNVFESQCKPLAIERIALNEKVTKSMDPGTKIYRKWCKSASNSCVLDLIMSLKDADKADESPRSLDCFASDIINAAFWSKSILSGPKSWNMELWI
jgi:hypothetical protein